MASSSGNSSGSTQIPNSGSEGDLMDLRKRKRMQSNRESARRSRMRKQKHLDDLIEQVDQLKKDNSQIQTTINATNQQLVHVEAENSVLRAQMGELSQRLDSLNEIINYMENNNNINNNCTTTYCTSGTSGMFDFEQADLGFMNNPWNFMYLNQQPIMAASDMFQY